MSIYRIAGHLIAETVSKQENPDAIPGFSCFRSEKEKPDETFLLHFDTHVPLLNWTVDPQHTFMFEQFVCDFSEDKGIYLFRMALPENEHPLLMEIHREDEGFRAVSNLGAGQKAKGTGKSSFAFRPLPFAPFRFALWVALGVAALHRQTVAAHASAVMYGGKSVLFLGESGTGKSTHTQLWLRHIPDTELLNDDSPFLNVSDDINVYGSPWSGKTPCYKALKTPLAALVRLRQAPFNQIKRLNTLEAIGAVLPSFPAIFAYDKTLSGYMHDILSGILQQAPVYTLDCLPDASAAKLVFDTLRKNGSL